MVTLKKKEEEGGGRGGGEEQQQQQQLCHRKGLKEKIKQGKEQKIKTGCQCS